MNHSALIGTPSRSGQPWDVGISGDLDRGSEGSGTISFRPAMVCKSRDLDRGSDQREVGPSY